MEKDRWYAITNIDALDSPALVVYPDRVEKNISVLVSMVDDVKRLRPHVKTHKTKEATLLMMDAGINKFKCATIAEAEMLAICGAAEKKLQESKGALISGPVGPGLALATGAEVTAALAVGPAFAVEGPSGTQAESESPTISGTIGRARRRGSWSTATF